MTLALELREKSDWCVGTPVSKCISLLISQFICQSVFRAAVLEVLQAQYCHRIYFLCMSSGDEVLSEEKSCCRSFKVLKPLAYTVWFRGWHRGTSLINEKHQQVPPRALQVKGSKGHKKKLRNGGKNVHQTGVVMDRRSKQSCIIKKN